MQKYTFLTGYEIEFLHELLKPFTGLSSSSLEAGNEKYRAGGEIHLIVAKY